MKPVLVVVATAVSFAIASPVWAQLTPAWAQSTQADPARDAALRDCTAQVRKRVSGRSDDQNARVAAFKDCMVSRGQRP